MRATAAAAAAAAVAVVGVGVGVGVVVGAVLAVVVVAAVVVADEVGREGAFSAKQPMGSRHAGNHDLLYGHVAERSRGLASCCIPVLHFCWPIAPILAIRHHRQHTGPGAAAGPHGALEQRAAGQQPPRSHGKAARLHPYIQNESDCIGGVDRDAVETEGNSVGPGKGLGLTEMLTLGMVSLPR